MMVNWKVDNTVSGNFKASFIMEIGKRLVEAFEAHPEMRKLDDWKVVEVRIERNDK